MRYGGLVRACSITLFTMLFFCQISVTNTVATPINSTQTTNSAVQQPGQIVNSGALSDKVGSQHNSAAADGNTNINSLGSKNPPHPRGNGYVVSRADLIMMQENPQVDFSRYQKLMPSQNKDFIQVRDGKFRAIVKTNNFQDNAVLQYLTNQGFEQIQTNPDLSVTVGYLPINLYNFKLGTLTHNIVFTNLAYVEPDYMIQVNYVPNDPFYVNNTQYALANIEAPKAWDTTLGNHSVKVAVIDTGIDYTHPDLVNNYNASLGFDWVNYDSNPMDDNGHGTHVAGTIAAAINNNEGIAGVANVTIFAEKILDSTGSGFSSDAANGITDAVDSGANILSNSWSSTSTSTTVESAVQYALSHNVTVIAAAGNDATTTKHYPAAYNGVIAVGSTDQTKNLSYFSSYGDWVDVVAPGSDIISTYLGGGYATLSGTSMATPHVSGVAALILSQFPNYTPAMVENLLKARAIDLGAPGPDIKYGAGLVNASAVMQGLDDHDLSAIVTTDGYLPLNFASTINYGVSNIGLNNQSNFDMTLYIDSNPVATQSISSLNSSQTQMFSYDFTATVVKSYNISVGVTTVAGELNTANNAVQNYVNCIGQRFSFNQGEFFGYLHTFLNPYTVAYRFENMLDQRWQNVTAVLSLILGVGLESPNYKFDTYSGDLYDSSGVLQDFQFLIHPETYSIGQKVDIGQFGDQAGTVVSTSIMRDYFGITIPAYGIEYQGFTYYYHKETGILDGVNASTQLDVQLTNILPAGTNLVSVSTEMELVTNTTGNDGAIVAYVANQGTQSETVHVSIKQNGVSIYDQQIQIDAFQIYPLMDMANNEAIFVPMTGGAQTIILNVDPLLGELVTSDNSATRLLTGDLHEYVKMNTSYNFQDMTGAIVISLLLDPTYIFNLPFQAQFYDVLSNQIMVDTQGGVAFTRNQPFLFGSSGGYPSSNIIEDYYAIPYLLTNGYYDVIKYKSFGTYAVIEFELLNNLQAQMEIHSDGSIIYNYQVFGALPDGEYGMNHGGGVFGQSLDGLTYPVGNQSIEYLYDFNNAELTTKVSSSMSQLGLGVSYQLDVKVDNIGNTAVTSVPYTLSDNGTVLSSGTLGVAAHGTFNLHIQYTPSQLGLHNITIDVGLATNEMVSYNNVDSTFVSVVPASQVLGFVTVWVDDYSTNTGIQNVELVLTQNGAVLATGTTDINGFYNFTSLFVGNYSIYTNSSQYYNYTQNFSITTYGGFTSLSFSIQGVRPHWVNVLSESSSYTVDSTYHMELNISYIADIDNITVHFDQYSIVVYSAIFDIPLLTNGTHQITIQVFWLYHHSMNLIKSVTDNSVVQMYSLNVGDYFNYKIDEITDGIYYDGWLNFTVLSQIDPTTYNVSVEYRYYQGQNMLYTLSGYMVVSTVNGYIIDSNTSWNQGKFFIMGPFISTRNINDTFAGQYWDYYSTVNGTYTDGHYAVTSVSALEYQDANHQISEEMAYLNGTGFLYKDVYEEVWYGFTTNQNLTLTESNRFAIPVIPIISGNSNELVNVDSTTSPIVWGISDDGTTTYELYVDGVLNATGSATYVSYDPSFLSIGFHTLNLTVTDNDGHIQTFITTLTIYDGSAPEVSSSNYDLTYVQGDLGNSITVTVIDYSASTYSVTVNGDLYIDGTLNSGYDNFDVNLDYFIAGYYTILITVVDAYGNTATITVTVTVTSNTTTPPTTTPTTSTSSSPPQTSSTTTSTPTPTPSTSNPSISSETSDTSSKKGGLSGISLMVALSVLVMMFPIYRKLKLRK